MLLPASYRPGNDPRSPLVISPHGRGASGPSNAKFFGRMHARGSFAVVSPDGTGPRLKAFSYGYAGQIADLARMPQLSSGRSRGCRIDSERIYALGSSMGGQETLLLVARLPQLLAGAAAMDSVTDLARRYDQLKMLTSSAARRSSRSAGAPRSAVCLQSSMRARGRRDARPGTPQRVRRPQPAEPGAGNRALGRPAPDLVEQGGARSSSTRSTSRRRSFDELSRLGTRRAARPRLTWAAGHTRRRCARPRCCRWRCRDFGLLARDVEAHATSVRHEAAPRCADRNSRLTRGGTARGSLRLHHASRLRFPPDAPPRPRSSSLSPSSRPPPRRT